MPANLAKVIREIEESAAKSASAEINTCLVKIRKYAADDYETAYLLGKFVKTGIGRQLPESEMKKLSRVIRNNNLEDYFYLKQRPANERMDILALIFLISGIPLTYVGILQFINGDFSIGLRSKYLTKSVRGGGQPAILGFLLLIVAGMRYAHEIRRMRFIAYLDINQLPGLEENTATNEKNN